MRSTFNYEICEIGLSVDGTSVPFRDIRTDFKENHSVLGYHSLFTGIDKLSEGNFINRTEYENGYTLFAYDLTSDLCSGNHFDLVKQGNLSLNIIFKTALPKAVSIIMYMEYQKLIEINKSRQVILDYTI